MASSDEESEIFPDSVTAYEFVDGKNESVSFSCIPLCWVEDGSDLDVSNGSNVRIYVHGTTSDGLEKIYKQVVAWKCNLSSLLPQVFVLSKGNKHWIKLLKPRKRFEDIIRSTLVTVHFIHFVKNNPQAPAERIWSHLSRAFSSYDVQPCERDVLDHIGLIKDAFKIGIDLPQSEYMCKLLGEQPRKRRLIRNVTAPDKQAVKKARYVLDEAENIDSLNLLEEEVEDINPLDLSKREEELREGKEDDEEHGYDETEAEEKELQLFDTCCAICDNGGDILCCEGPCMRSFHPTRASGESSCRSLGLSQAQVDAMSFFYCKNCEYKKHQCSICGKLGSSDKHSGAEVFCCVSATCGRFYHAQCVAKALFPVNTAQARKTEAQIAAGDVFTCPAHKCIVCGHGEDRNVHALQFAVCRRCPKVYHRKCLPSGIPFEDDDDDDDENILQRAWDDLLPKRILIYCLDHEIIPHLATPSRKHIVFPETDMVKEKPVTVKVGTEKRILKNKGECVTKKLGQINKADKVVLGLRAPIVDLGLRAPIVEGSSKFSASHGKIQNKQTCHSSTTHGKIPVQKFKKSNKASAIMTKHVSVDKSHAGDMEQSKIESGINSLIEEVNSSFSMNVMKSHLSSDKSITMGKVEATVKAVRTALEKLDSGCSVEDAMEICGPEMLDQLATWKQRLQVSLGPFLHGMRYTSYGRHFTKPEKLQEIVDMIHWYVQDGDTIVDFSCGSNDFSCMMSEKLESAGKTCFFKNYDLHHTKNDFNFERRNWFSVQKEELPDGSRMIIGLNPPFGVQAKLANQFIERALEFKPKLLILIAPRETRRLDRIQSPYDLIWEDVKLLADKAFYLPGSIDVNNKQMEQWNVVSPPLSLWSRPDWTQKHREIAMTCSHLSRDTN